MTWSQVLSSTFLYGSVASVFFFVAGLETHRTEYLKAPFYTQCLVFTFHPKLQWSSLA